MKDGDGLDKFDIESLRIPEEELVRPDTHKKKTLGSRRPLKEKEFCKFPFHVMASVAKNRPASGRGRWSNGRAIRNLVSRLPIQSRQINLRNSTKIWGISPPETPRSPIFGKIWMYLGRSRTREKSACDFEMASAQKRIRTVKHLQICRGNICGSVNKHLQICRYVPPSLFFRV